MGPRSRERGEGDFRIKIGATALLQWGRARGSAERISVAINRIFHGTLQWGRARGSAESGERPEAMSFA